MSKSFKIALLIPHFNQIGKLHKSLETVHFSGDMIIVVVDDGSDEENRPDEQWRADQEETKGFPVHLIIHDRNRGIEMALNTGLEFILTRIQAKYIARLDCGDFNVSHRFNLQYEFMEAHPDVCLLGSWAEVLEEGRTLYTIRTPVSHGEIQNRMLSNNCFIHPTVMLRTTAVRDVGMYPTQYPAAEDFAYFFLFVKKFRTANIPEALVTLPKYDDGISYRRRRAQLVSRIRIIARYFEFTRHGVWGLLRACLLLAIPVKIIEFLKTAHDRTSHH